MSVLKPVDATRRGDALDFSPTRRCGTPYTVSDALAFMAASLRRACARGGGRRNVGGGGRGSGAHADVLTRRRCHGIWDGDEEGDEPVGLSRVDFFVGIPKFRAFFAKQIHSWTLTWTDIWGYHLTHQQIHSATEGSDGRWNSRPYSHPAAAFAESCNLSFGGFGISEEREVNPSSPLIPFDSTAVPRFRWWSVPGNLAGAVDLGEMNWMRIWILRAIRVCALFVTAVVSTAYFGGFQLLRPVLIAVTCACMPQNLWLASFAERWSWNSWVWWRYEFAAYPIRKSCRSVPSFRL
jgi:hypothetical protein